MRAVTPVRYAVVLSWTTATERTLYSYPTSFGTIADAAACARRIIAEGGYDTFAVYETFDFYTARPLATLALTGQVAA